MRLRRNDQIGRSCILDSKRISRRELFRVTNVTEWESKIREKISIEYSNKKVTNLVITIMVD